MREEKENRDIRASGPRKNDVTGPLMLGACILSSFVALSGAAIAESVDVVPGQVFSDCDSCPEMVVIPQGIFQPRKPTAKAGPGSDTGRQRTTVIRQFALGKTEVTQRQWTAVMGRNPSRFSQCGEDCPVERVSWKDVQEFIRRLNQATGRIYRLPGDAEWEYACLAGGANPYCGGDKLESVAWYESNSARTTHPVAGKLPNAWGLHDMTGNVWEWTQDCPDDKPTSMTVGDCKRPNLRGGSWGSMQRLVTSSYRDRYPAKSRAYDIVSRRSDFGFRLAATLP